MNPARRPNPCRLCAQAAALAALAFASSCNTFWADLELERRTETSGTFESSGWNLTLLSFDLPRVARQSALDNVADARLDNVDVIETTEWPYLGPFDWLLDIIGVRFATVKGTWGWTGE